MSLPITLRYLDHGRDLPLPSYGTPDSAGFDLYAALSSPVILEPMARLLVPTGISLIIPQGFEGQIRPRSGLALKHGITVLNSPGTIDADYRGEILVLLINFSSSPYTLERGMRVAQLVVAPYSQVVWTLEEDLQETRRGREGFGSTGY